MKLLEVQIEIHVSTYVDEMPNDVFILVIVVFKTVFMFWLMVTRKAS